MDRRKFLKKTAFIAAGVGLIDCDSLIAANYKNKRPNIVHILIDDLGFSDIGCYGSDFCETPNIDNFAAEGMRFTNGYSAAPICSPSRAAFLTGKSPARLNFEFVTQKENQRFDWNQEWYDKWSNFKLVPPPYTVNLPLEELTIAEALKSVGYITGITGKWHVSGHHKHYNGWSLTHGPKQQGFDWAKDTYGAHPWGTKKQNRNKYGSFKMGQYPEDELTQSAIGFMTDCKEKDKQFFLFASHYYVHTPLGTKCKWLIDKYRQKAEKNGKEYSDARILYAAFVETLDHYVGQLLKAIKDLGLENDTLVVFTSDNGGHPVHAFNAPLRGSKWNLYEGGIRVPTIARWPKVIEANTVNDTPIVGMDFMPTYCQIADAENKNHKDLDGKNILPVLRGGKGESRKIVWHFPYYHWRGDFQNCPVAIGHNDGYVSQTKPQSCIRDGDYKLIYFYESKTCQLYNLKIDPYEQNDLSNEIPQKTKQLKDSLLTYLRNVNGRLPRER